MALPCERHVALGSGLCPENTLSPTATLLYKTELAAVRQHSQRLHDLKRQNPRKSVTVAKVKWSSWIKKNLPIVLTVGSFFTVFLKGLTLMLSFSHFLL